MNHLGEFTSHTMYLQDFTVMALAMHMRFPKQSGFFFPYLKILNEFHIYLMFFLNITEKEYAMTFAAVLERRFFTSQLLYNALKFHVWEFKSLTG